MAKRECIRRQHDQRLRTDGLDRQSLAPTNRAASPSTMRNDQGMHFFCRTHETRPGQNSSPGASSGGWQRFAPHPAESPAQAPAGRSNGAVAQPRHQGSAPYSNRGPAPGYTRRGPSPDYNSQPNYAPPRYTARPPLNLSRPIISGPPRGAPSRGPSGRGSVAPRGGSSGRSSGSSRRR